jgi:hypothetical protein
MNKHRGIRLSVLAAVVGALLTAVYILPNYHALAIKRFFNCMTGIANKTGILTIGDVNGCYYKKYPEFARQLGVHLSSNNNNMKSTRP